MKIAWRNVWRNPRRTLLTLLALAFATAMLLFMFAWQQGSYAAMIHAAVSTTTGQMQVLRYGYATRPEIRKAVDDPQPVTRKLAGMDAVRAFAPRAEAFALLDSGTRSAGVMVLGLDVAGEPQVTSIRALVRAGGYFSGEEPEILLGRRLADNLRSGVGDSVVLVGQGFDGSVAANAFLVRGIIESGLEEMDRTLAAIPLGVFQQTFSMDGRVHRIAITCESLHNLEEVSIELGAFLGKTAPGLEVLTWDQLLPGLRQSIELDLISGYIFYVLLLVVVAFSIMNTFLMAVLERTREFGILNAVGTTRRRLVRMLMFETGMLAACGILAGMAVGIAVTWYVQQVGISIPGSENIMSRFGLPERIHAQLSWLVVCLAPALVLAVTILSAVYPALRVLRLQPAAAMHNP